MTGIAESAAAALGRYHRKTGGGFMAQCPAHEDRTPSLAIDESDRGLLVKCFAGCSQDAVVESMKARGAWPAHSKPLPPLKKQPQRETWRPVMPVPGTAPIPKDQHARHGKPAQEWWYKDRDGRRLYRVCRFETDRGKEILPQTLCTDGDRFSWRWQGPPEPRPLYGLDRLVEGLPVLVVEGEKAADAAQRLLGDTWAVITWSGGSNAVDKAEWSPLRDMDVVVWPDADGPGTKAALAVAEAAGFDTNTLRIVSPPGNVSVGWDLADAESEGWSAGEVFSYLERAVSPLEFRKAVTMDGHVPAKIQGNAPRPLPDELAPVAEFTYDLLPASVRRHVQDTCERIQCPPDFVAVGAMTALASVIGRKVGLRPQARTDWTVTCNLWGLIVGRPGVLKSPGLEAALSPLKRLSALAQEQHIKEYDEFKAQATVAKLKAEAGEKEARKLLAKDPGADVLALLAVPEVEEPALKRYIANDPTPAALGELLRQNPNGLLVFRDELVSLLRSLDREDQAEGRGFYLTAWNGDSSYTFDRIGRGLNLHIPAVCLSLLGGTQPGRLSEYIRHAVKGGAADDGLIQRFGLLVWPDIGGEWRDVDRLPDCEAKKEAGRVFDYLSDLDPSRIGADQDEDYQGQPDGIPYLRFDAGGLGLFQEWRIDLEQRLRSGELHPALESHLSKYRKLVPSLALIIHLAEGNTGPVGKGATLQALAWGEYLESHARRAYGSVSQPEATAAKAILKRIRNGDLPGEFSSRDVKRPGWSMLNDSEQVQSALDLLVDYDWLLLEQRETGGRPAKIYTINSRGQE